MPGGCFGFQPSTLLEFWMNYGRVKVEGKPQVVLT